jgi:hypothetical protein
MHNGVIYLTNDEHRQALDENGRADLGEPHRRTLIGIAAMRSMAIFRTRCSSPRPTHG